MRLRVAAYCRVSTDREDQVNSLHSQQTYFRSYIHSHADWLLAEVYADEGTSGTSTRRREAFHRMIRDAEAHRLDLILTKEVSRFARNTVDTLEYTRKLKRLGVGVVFIGDHIDTRENDGELRLTIMASIAQEESRKTSERVKWGQKRRMEAGVVFGNDSTYGFHTRGGSLTVKETEADVIRHIYHKFLDEGKGTHVIARELYEEGIDPPRAASGKWSCAMVRRILRNEKYVGDLLQKKFVTTDYLTHQKAENRGSEEQVYLREHHEAIVARSTWEAAQEELIRRNAGREEGSRYSGRYWCSGKIRCGSCGSRFVLRQTKRPNGEIYRIWGCHSRVHYGNWKRNDRGDDVGCNMRMINDKTLVACVQFVIRQLNLDYDALVTELAEEIWQVQRGETGSGTPARREAQRAELDRKKERAMDAYFTGTISKEELLQMKARYDGQLERLDAQRRRAEDAEQARQGQDMSQEELRGLLRESAETSEAVYEAVIEGVTIDADAITIKIQHLPLTFRLWYHTGGTGVHYTTTIDRWERSPQQADSGA